MGGGKGQGKQAEGKKGASSKGKGGKPAAGTFSGGKGVAQPPGQPPAAVWGPPPGDPRVPAPAPAAVSIEGLEGDYAEIARAAMFVMKDVMLYKFGAGFELGRVPRGYLFNGILSERL